VIVNQSEQFLAELAKQASSVRTPVCARAVMLVEPAEFTICRESAADNRYMNLHETADPGRALQQWRALVALIADQGIAVVRFSGDPKTPDAVFPNNVFASTSKNFIIGHMLHPGRQQEAGREDIRAYFKLQGYATIDLSLRNCIAELTGPVVIDTTLQIGFCGMTGWVDAAGLEAMNAAFVLKMLFSFTLQPGEYHTNVIMMVLAGRACVIYPGAFIDLGVPDVIESAFPGRTLVLNEEKKCLCRQLHCIDAA